MTKRKTHVSVREKKGGGTRDVSVNINSTVDDLIATAQSKNFPDGKSFFGDLSTMVSSLGNFKCQPIPKDDFTLAKYISTHSLTTVRLYLMTTVDNNFRNTTSNSNGR